MNNVIIINAVTSPDNSAIKSKIGFCDLINLLRW